MKTAILCVFIVLSCWSLILAIIFKVIKASSKMEEEHYDKLNKKKEWKTYSFSTVLQFIYIYVKRIIKFFM